MHRGLLGLDSECMRGFLVLEYRRGGAKNSDLSRKGMSMKLGCAAYLELP